MPIVSAEMAIDNATEREVWDVVSDFSKYPSFMPDVMSVAFVEKTGRSAVSNWCVRLNDAEFTWTERDTFHPNKKIEFESIEGDIEFLRGAWSLISSDQGVVVSLTIEFDLGIPSLAEVLHPVASEALEVNARSMLAALRDRIL